MSSSLMWRPVMPVKGYDLPDELKYVISRKLWDTDGSCGDGEALLDSSDIGYLHGLKDAGVKGAATLIEAIEKYGQITLWHQF